MAGLGFKDFQVGEVLTAADVDGYLMQQSVMRFADSAARGSALGTAVGTGVALAEGMVAYLDDVNQVELFDGTVWRPTGTILQVVSTTKTDTFSTSANALTGVTGLSVSITPSSATSKILLIARVSVSSDPAATRLATGLLRDATLIGLGNAASSRSRSMDTVGNATANYADPSMLLLLDSPATTSATTYQVAVTNTEQTGQTVYVNRSQSDTDNAFIWRTSSTITAVEVAA